MELLVDRVALLGWFFSVVLNSFNGILWDHKVTKTVGRLARLFLMEIMGNCFVVPFLGSDILASFWK
jgi:hypothetical protein